MVKLDLLESINNAESENFWVGETQASIHIRRGFNGILSNWVFDGRGNQLGFIQTESNLIRGGETDWQIRTEFMIPNKVSPVLLDQSEIYIALVIFKDH